MHWGFHLALDHENQMVIDKVEDGTMCSFYMSPGDAVLKVAGRSAKAMSVEKAQHLIQQAGNAVEIIIKK
ncbi:PDZ domain-containing protein [Caerostris extrusa]|uniref:PDZ domain-containing protein n=1 Tax=Caerostris extrusa TaxID=172846 RepID=A0AAV4P4C1_CAEEX|nr:PDZ domain-containing protein [Caerostris extrusa]